MVHFLTHSVVVVVVVVIVVVWRSDRVASKKSRYFHYHADERMFCCSGSGPSITRTSMHHVTTRLGRFSSSDVMCLWNCLSWTGSQTSRSILTTPTSSFVFLMQVLCIITTIGHATSLNTAFAVRMSVHPSLCYTCDPCLNGSCYKKIRYKLYDSVMFLAFEAKFCSHTFRGSPTTRGTPHDSEKLISCPPYLGNVARYDVNQYYSRIGSHIKFLIGIVSGDP